MIYKILKKRATTANWSRVNNEFTQNRTFRKQQIKYEPTESERGQSC